MGKVQKCNKNCGKLITVQMDPTIGKYVPFEVDLGGNPTQKHNCPNSEYNKQQQAGSYNTMNTTASTLPLSPSVNTTGTTSTTPPVDRPSLEATLLNQVSQKLDKLLANQEAIVEVLQGNQEINKQNHMMLDALIGHFKLTEPKKASELYQESQEEKAQREREEIASWNNKPNKEPDQ